MRDIPGLQEESLASALPVDFGSQRAFEIEAKSAPPDGWEPVQFLVTGSDYFRLVGASAIAGRDFNGADRERAAPVAIVNQSFAARFFSGEEPIGKRLRFTNRNTPGEWLTIVGVVPNIMQGDATREHFKPLVYVPFRQQPPARAVFLLRTTAPPAQIAAAVRAGVETLDSGVIFQYFGTLKAHFAFHRDLMDGKHAELGKHAALAPIFAAIAVLLAAAGLYALIAHSISQRIKEIGVRMAVGATPGDIRSMVLVDGLLPVALGMIIGLAASLGTNHLLQSQLVGLSPYDLPAMAAAPAFLLSVALVACHIPARRAMRVNPAVALRDD